MRRKLIIKQRDLADCGVCCIASIVKYYGHNISLEYLRNETNTNKSGTTALDLIECLKRLGFDANGYKFNDILEKEITIPCIAHVTLENGLNHFVVIYKILSNITIMDPALGEKTLTKEEFKKIWTGVIINLHPLNLIINEEEKITLLIMFYIKNNITLTGIIILMSFLTMITIIILNYNYEIMLELIKNHNFKIFRNVLIYFAVLTLLKVILEVLRNYYENNFIRVINKSLYNKFITHSLYIPSNTLNSRSSGELMTRVNELESIKILIVDLWLGLAVDLLFALCTIWLLYKINATLLLIVVIILSTYFIFVMLFNKIIYRKSIECIHQETKFNDLVLENFNNIYSIQNLNLLKKRELKSKSVTNEYCEYKYSYQKFLNNLEGIKLLIIESGLFILNTYAFYLIYNGRMEIVSLMTFNALLLYVFTPIKNSIELIPKFHILKASLTKINDYMHIKEENLKETSEIFKNGSITFDNVSFSHNRNNKVLNKVNFTLNEKEKVIIYGQSGGGKSTICKLLNGTLTKYSGNILIGDVNILDYQLSTIRKNILYVSQEETIFNDTIYENLTLGKYIEMADIQKVINICELNKVIDKLPLRLHSVIYNDANNLSGGERQRLLVARSLLQESKILILDESLSEVPLTQEERIINKINKTYKDKTIIYISHKNPKNKFDKVIRLTNDK